MSIARVLLGKFSVVKPNGKFIKHRRCDSLGLARIVAGGEQIRICHVPYASSYRAVIRAECGDAAATEIPADLLARSTAA